MKEGFYSEESTIDGNFTTPNRFSRSEVVVVEGVGKIDLHLMIKAELRGVIKLPAEIDVLTEGIEIDLIPWKIDMSSARGYSFKISAGETETAFRMELAEGNYALKYNLRSEVPELLQQGYYTNQGIVGDFGKADIIRITNDMPENKPDRKSVV